MLYTMQSKAFCCHLYHTYLTLCKIILYDELEGGGRLAPGVEQEGQKIFFEFFTAVLFPFNMSK